MPVETTAADFSWLAFLAALGSEDIASLTPLSAIRAGR